VIAVEIKSFLRDSEVADLEDAPGQFVLYRAALRRHEPARRLVLAVPLDAFESVWSDDVGRDVMEDEKIPLLVFDPMEEVIRPGLPRPVQAPAHGVRHRLTHPPPSELDPMAAVGSPSPDAGFELPPLSC
jgi:XisH protein